MPDISGLGLRFEWTSNTMEINGEPRKITLVSNDSDDRLLKLLSAQASKLQAEVFKQVLFEGNVDNFKQFILTCLDKWKSDNYIHDKVGTILALTNYPDEHYGVCSVYVFEGKIGHLCQYYCYGCNHVPIKNKFPSTVIRNLLTSLKRVSDLKWIQFWFVKEKANCTDAVEKQIEQIHISEPYIKEHQKNKARIMNAQEEQAAHETPADISHVVPHETPETQLIASTQDNDAQEQIGESEVGSSLQDETHEPVGHGVATSKQSRFCHGCDI